METKKISKTKSEKFVLSKKDSWENLRKILSTISLKGFKVLDDTQVLEFPRLYRLACTDLAEAKMLKLSPDVLDYLNNIVGQAHKYLYSFPPLKKSSIKLFFTRKLPHIFFKSKHFIALSAFLFLTSFFISFFVVLNNPKAASSVVPKGVLHQMEQSYSEPIGKTNSAAYGTMASTFYIQHNISIAFMSFAAGVLFGLGSIYFLIYNGIILGSIFGYIFALGHGKNIMRFVTAHTFFEITGLILAGAAGLLLGFTIIKATRYYRKDSLKLQKKNIFHLVFASALLLFFAALIEGFISPSNISYSARLVVALISFCSLLIYFVIYPLSQKKLKSKL